MKLINRNLHKDDSDPTTTHAVALVRLGDHIPAFEADSTWGRINIGDYVGHWLVFFSYNADFTAVSSSEIIAFAELQKRLQLMGGQVIGLSTDSISSHFPWLESIENWWGEKINYPIIGDENGQIAAQFGMMMSEVYRRETARCTFIVDGNQMLRSFMAYPDRVGRSTDEIYRLVEALRSSTSLSLATPANWEPGEELIQLTRDA